MSESTHDNTIARLLPEWLGGNQHRAYPLDVDSYGSGIPTQLLVDAFFLVSAGIDRVHLYISDIVKGNTNLHISLAGYLHGMAVSFGVVATVPYNTKTGTHVPISVSTADYTISGDLVIGSMDCVSQLPTALELTENSGRIFPGCVRVIDSSLLGISVDGQLYTGIVTLSAGDGVDIQVVEREDSTEIIISSTAYSEPSENTTIVDDSSLLRQAMELYGKPVTSLCGVKPDDNGNISIVSPSDDKQYIAVTQVGDGAISLGIANDQTVTQCVDTTAQIESLAVSLSNLNERSGAIHEGVQAMDNALSNLSLQVSRS